MCCYICDSPNAEYSAISKDGSELGLLCKKCYNRIKDKQEANKPKENNMTDAEIYEVIEGFKNGKTLETYSCAVGKWTPVSFMNLMALMHSMLTSNIPVRIKPVPKYRPFETVEEALAIRDKWVSDNNKDSRTYYRILAISKIDNNILVGLDDGKDRYLTCKELLNEYEFTFEDGTPFGVEVK